MDFTKKITLQSTDYSPLLAIVFFILITLFSSCKEDAFKSNEELLATGSWKLQSIIAEPPYALDDGTLVTDMYTLEPDCALDNTITYTEEGTYYRSEGTTVCSWAEPISEPGYWRIETRDGEKMIEYDYDEPDGINFSLKLKSISSDQLILVYKGSSRVETMTYNNVQ